MIEHSINNLDNFICGYKAEDVSICDKLIDYFNTQPHREGSTSGGIKKNIKDSLDCSLLDRDLALEYISWMNKSLDLYKKKYPWCDKYAPFTITQAIQLQHYKPNGGYFGWHSERTNTKPHILARHLVFMTYLNDVTDGGETEWYHQKLKVKPEKGLTVIWPADWTFTHHGLTSPTQDKYIATGWLSYIDHADVV